MINTPQENLERIAQTLEYMYETLEQIKQTKQEQNHILKELVSRVSTLAYTR